MTSRWSGVLALFLLVAAASCGGAKPGRAAAVSSTSTTAFVRSTTRQVAAIVAKDRPQLIDAIDLDDQCAARYGVLPCSQGDAPNKRLAAIGDKATQMASDLDMAKPVSPEVASLVDSTIDELRAYTTKLTQPNTYSDLEHGYLKIKADLRAWDAYITAS